MTQDERRQKMPQCTAFIDSMRAAFGKDQVVYINAQENGLSVEWGTGSIRAGEVVEIIPGCK